MLKLSPDNIFTSPSRLNWSVVGNLSDLIVLPDPTEDDLYHAGYSADHLSKRGMTVPSSEEDAYRFAISVFLEASASAKWKSQFEPTLPVFWPCKFTIDVKDAANAMYEAGLFCVLVTGQVDDITEVKGFALTAGGANLSDHLSAAYMCCGQLPPVLVAERAVEINAPKMEAELREAVDGIVSHLQHSISKLGDVMNVYAGPRPG